MPSETRWIKASTFTRRVGLLLLLVLGTEALFVTLSRAALNGSLAGLTLTGWYIYLSIKDACCRQPRSA